MYRRLGRDRVKVKTVYISVDPERAAPISGTTATRMFECACCEANYWMPVILRGARAQEQ